jgi:hydroxyacylglutathione hydrolase
MKKRFLNTILLIQFILLFHCSSADDLTVTHQVTGGIETNCYLLVDSKSKEASLFDIGGDIDSLTQIIDRNQLDLKYIFCTHGHFDHIIGVPAVKAKYPNTKVCIHELDYNDMSTQKQWAIDNLGPDFVNYLLSDPERKKIYDFDVESFGKPDILIEEGQTFRFGHTTIKAIHSPGHSPGSVCFHVDDLLFSGDVLFYRTVGRTDTQNGSQEDQVKSVRQLYAMFEDETRVYPGHGRFTDIGSEKKFNERISMDGGSWNH